MKKFIILLSAAAIFSACKTGDKKVTGTNGTGDSTVSLTPEEKQKALTDSSNYTTLEWIDATTRDLGKLVKDQSIEVTFRFKNTGDKALIIENVSAQCGCTIPEKPEQPFAPGQEGIIKAKFNGSGQGTISKQIYVKANTKPLTDHTLTFTGEIQEKK